MQLIRRFVVALCVALLLSNYLTLEPSLSVSANGVTLTILWSNPVVARPDQVVQPTVEPTPTATLAPTPTPRPSPTPVPLSASTTVLAYAPPPIQARAAILVDVGTGKVLFAQNPDQRLPMASTTKITTAAVVLQRAKLSELATVSEKAATIGESTMVLERGERLTVLQLLYGLLLNSANDAAITLAEHVGGTEAHFVQMMNALAKSLHMRNTHYVTSHGLDAPDHYSSARDLATIARYAMRNPIFRQIVGSTSYYIPPTKHNHAHWLASVNRVIYWYPGVDGVKPGQTDAAGLCQVVSVRRDGKHLLAVLLNTPTLVTDIRNLLNFGLHDFRWVQAPLWFDGPSGSLSGGPRSAPWLFYYGAGHYIRGLFLAYFNTHGGLRTLGYPRTEQVEENGRLVQYFQGGELIYDPAHRSVYPADLGRTEAERSALKAIVSSRHERVAAPLAGLYSQLGGRGVLGAPITGTIAISGHSAQFYQYGELAMSGGAANLVPVGDAELRAKGWLPAAGASDAYASTMAPQLLPALAQVARPFYRHLRTHRRLHRHGHGHSPSRKLRSSTSSATLTSVPNAGVSTRASHGSHPGRVLGQR